MLLLKPLVWSSKYRWCPPPSCFIYRPLNSPLPGLNLTYMLRNNYLLQDSKILDFRPLVHLYVLTVIPSHCESHDLLFCLQWLRRADLASNNCKHNKYVLSSSKTLNTFKHFIRKVFLALSNTTKHVTLITLISSFQNTPPPQSTICILIHPCNALKCGQKVRRDGRISAATRSTIHVLWTGAHTRHIWLPPYLPYLPL